MFVGIVDLITPEDAVQFILDGFGILLPDATADIIILHEANDFKMKSRRFVVQLQMTNYFNGHRDGNCNKDSKTMEEDKFNKSL